MNKTKIEWADYTWNPIKGLCPVGCWYCYARKLYKRFKWDEKIQFMAIKTGSEYLMGYYNTPAILRKPSRIFICSTMEIFHPMIPKEWRDEIFRRINLFPQHTFIILTKRPARIDRPMPDNVWLGVTVTGKLGDDGIRSLCLSDHGARIKFVSFEPLLGDVAMKGWSTFPDYIDKLSWVIIGRLTGHGHVHDPSRANIKRIVDECRAANIPVFLKNNLREIWNGRLIQEFPRCST